MPPRNTTPPDVIDISTRTMWLGQLAAAQAALGDATLNAWRANPHYRCVSYTTGDVWTFNDKYVVPAHPPELRKQLLLLAHERGAHVGVARSIDNLRKMWVYWEGSNADVKRHVAECGTCQREGPAAQQRTNTMRITEPPSRPWSLVQLDVLTLPEGEGGYKYVISAVDYLTKFVVLAASKTNTAAAVVKALHEGITLPYGPCDWLVTDGGSSVNNKDIDSYCARYNIGQHISRAGHSGAHGAVERVNQSVAELLRKWLAGSYKSHKTWPTALPEVARALNQCHHASIGMAPQVALHGTAPSLLAGAEIAGGPTTIAVADVSHLVAIIDATHHKAYNNLLASTVKYKRYYDSVARTRNFRVGDHVLIHNISREHKLQTYYNDVGVITEKVNDSTYTVRRRLSGKTENMHTNRLIPYNADRTTDTSELRRLLQPGEQIPERIVKHHAADTSDDGGKTTYKFMVHWAGLPAVFDSWHPPEHLLHLDIFKTYCTEHSLDELVPRRGRKKFQVHRHRPAAVH